MSEAILNLDLAHESPDFAKVPFGERSLLAEPADVYDESLRKWLGARVARPRWQRTEEDDVAAGEHSQVVEFREIRAHPTTVTVYGMAGDAAPITRNLVASSRVTRGVLKVDRVQVRRDVGHFARREFGNLDAFGSNHVPHVGAVIPHHGCDLCE